jgi:hypothetical protein
MEKPILLLLTIFFSFTCFSREAAKDFSSFERARQHPIMHEGPAPDFFEGALIGNGGLGAVVCIMVNVEGQTELESNETEISTKSGEALTFMPIN